MWGRVSQYNINQLWNEFWRNFRLINTMFIDPHGGRSQPSGQSLFVSVWLLLMVKAKSWLQCGDASIKSTANRSERELLVVALACPDSGLSPSWWWWGGKREEVECTLGEDGERTTVDPWTLMTFLRKSTTEEQRSFSGFWRDRDVRHLTWLLLCGCWDLLVYSWARLKMYAVIMFDLTQKEMKESGVEECRIIYFSNDVWWHVNQTEVIGTVCSTLSFGIREKNIPRISELLVVVLSTRH